MSTAGAKPLLTADRAKRICDLVAGGTPMLYAAESEGISERVLYKWMSKGEADGADQLYVQFVQDIKKARAKALSFRVKRIRRHGAKSWQADAWWCERMFPDEFGTDRRLVKDLAESVTKLQAELEEARAVARRTQAKPRKRKKRRGGTVRGHGEGV